MLLTNFYILADQNHACGEGLNYLKNWMKKHPNKLTTTDFFNAHKNVKFDFAACSPSGYMRWIFRNLLDWSELGYGCDIPIGADFLNPKTRKFIKELLGTDQVTSDNTTRKIAEALIRAFKDVDLCMVKYYI